MVSDFETEHVAPLRRQSRARRGRCLLAALIALGLVGAAPAVAQERPAAVSTQDAARAAEQFAKGRALVAAGTREQALEAFREAYRLDPRPAAHAGNLGAVELHLGHHREAAVHLAEAIQRLEINAPKPQFDALTSLLKAAEAEVGKLRVVVGVPSKLTVDGEPMGDVEQERVVLVEPGRRVVVASARGYRTARAELDVGKGEQRDVTLRLELEATPRPTPASPTPAADQVTQPQTDQPGARNLLPLVVGGAIAATAAGFGVGFLVHSGNRADDAEALRASLGAKAGASQGFCAEPVPADRVAGCADLREAVDGESSARNTAIGFFIGAGAAAAVGAGLYLLLPPQRRPSAQRISVLPAVAADAGSVVVTGTF
jgi:tetratricopeptide (TPR) repeat protein